MAFGIGKDGTHYQIVISSNRFGEQDIPYNFPTREDAIKYAHKEMRAEKSIQAYKLFHKRGHETLAGVTHYRDGRYDHHKNPFEKFRIA